MGGQHTRIKRVLPKLLDELHKVTLHERDLAIDARLFRVLPRSLNLEIVVVQANNIDVCEAGDFAGWSTDTTANIQDAHAGAEDHLGREVVLVARDGSGEALALVEPGKVERLAPPIFVQFRYGIVVACRS